MSSARLIAETTASTMVLGPTIAPRNGASRTHSSVPSAFCSVTIEGASLSLVEVASVTRPGAAACLISASTCSLGTSVSQRALSTAYFVFNGASFAATSGLRVRQATSRRGSAAENSASVRILSTGSGARVGVLTIPGDGIVFSSVNGSTSSAPSRSLSRSPWTNACGFAAKILPIKVFVLRVLSPRIRHAIAHKVSPLATV